MKYPPRKLTLPHPVPPLPSLCNIMNGLKKEILVFITLNREIGITLGSAESL